MPSIAIGGELAHCIPNSSYRDVLAVFQIEEEKLLQSKVHKLLQPNVTTVKDAIETPKMGSASPRGKKNRHLNQFKLPIL